MNFKIHQGMNQDILKEYPDNHFDSIVTDPPYGIEFLGKDWDSNTGAVETWQECYRVLKPGGHLLAFSAARTYHHLATNIENCGFEIRDQLMWIYASGFPKAQDIGKAIQRRQGVEEYEGFVDTTKNAGFGQTDYARVRAGVEWSTREKQVGKAKCTSAEARQWSGWKTALKPAHEPIVMARKPFKGSTIDNVLEYGTGALNIDATRIPFVDEKDLISAAYGQNPAKTFGYIDTEQQDSYTKQDIQVVEANEQGRFPSNVVGEIPDYQKYFYCPKVTRRERHTGFEQDPTGNNHPTVKPVALMKYLIQLVTPEGGRVLDPFTGSGSTGMAAVELGHEFVGCELDPNYVEIAKKRIAGWNQKTPQQQQFEKVFDATD